VVRNEDPTQTGDIIPNGDHIVAELDDPQTTNFIDTNAVDSPYAEYQVIGLLSGDHGTRYLFSNRKVHRRDGINQVMIVPKQVLPDVESKRLYLFNQYGNIVLYNYADGKIEKDTMTNYEPGRCDIGTFEGRKELYIPRRDGYLCLYDAATLDEVKKVRMSEVNELSWLKFDSGNLYLTVAPEIPSMWQPSLRVYQRSSFSLLNVKSLSGPSQLEKVPGDQHEFLVLSTQTDPQSIWYFHFTENGSIRSYSEQPNPQNNLLDGKVFGFLPGGKGFVTSSAGALYDTSLNFKQLLPDSCGEYTSYAVDRDKKLLFCGCRSAMRVEVFTTTDFSHVKSYETKAYPRFLVLDGQLISVGCTSVEPVKEHFVVETIDVSN
jgi:hypothetical protein